MTVKNRIIAVLVLVGSLWSVAALSPLTAKSWFSTQSFHFGARAALPLSTSPLPVHMLRAPAFAPITGDLNEGRFSLIQRIDLKKYFGFAPETLIEKETFRIALDNHMYTIKKKSVETLPDGYHWQGIIDDNEKQTMVMTYLKGFAGATIVTAKGTYSIEFEHGRHVLKKLDLPTPIAQE